MQVTLLGPVAADAGGRQLPLGGRKQRAVFALLALSANRIVSLDRLVYEIWHDEPPARATLSLQAYVSRLRGVRADASSDRPAQILTRPPGWMLQIPAQQIDASRFATLVADARVLLAAGNAGEAAGLLREALGLWSGEPLAGLYEDGLAIEDVGRLQEQRLEASELMYEAGLGVGEAAAIVTATRKFVSQHPYRERAWCALILALYRSGRQADALAAARELRLTLAEGLGLDPSPEARELEDRILRHDAALARPLPPPREPAGARTQVTQVGAPQRVTEDAVVGRRAELDVVVTAVKSAIDGSGRLVVLDGPAGMGKSTILRRLEKSVRAVGGVVLRGGGVGAGAMPALWPWVTIVRQLIDTVPDLTGPGLDGPAARVLALLDPALGDGAPAPPADAGLARTRLYRAVLDLLTVAREHRAVAVVLDDAQWLDHETLDLLALAVDELLPRGVLFAIALRPDESGEVRDAIAALSAGAPDSAVRLTLTGFDADSVGQIMRCITGHVPDPEVVEAVRSRTAGNPFFVAELARLLISERRLDPDGVYTLLPAGIRDVLRRRLDRLPAQTLAVLGVVALMGRAVDVDLLAEVTEMSADRVLDGCEAAVLAGLLLDDPVTDGFRLSHDLVRQTLDEALSAARRARLHARIGNALCGVRGVPSPERVVEIAHHLTLAASVAGPAAAVPYLLTAADDAMVRLASQQGEEYLRTAERLAAQIADLPTRAQREHEIRSRRVVTGGIVSSAADGAVRWSARSPLPEPGPAVLLDPEAPAAWWNATAVFLSSGNNASALAAGEHSLRDDLPPGAAAVVQFVLGVASFELGLHERAGPHFIRTEQLQREVPGGATRGMFSFAGTATVLHAASATADGADRADLLLSAWETPDMSPVQSAAVEYWTAWCAVQRGEPLVAQGIAQNCHDRAVELGSAFYELNSRMVLGWAAAVQGDRSGIDVLDSAYTEYRAMGILHQVTVHLILRAEAYTHHGELARARELVRESREVAMITGESMLGPRLSALAQQLVPASTYTRTS